MTDPSGAPGAGDDYDPAAYGEGCAEFYQQLYPRLAPDAAAALDVLARLGPVLDLGVGTGRAAVALAQRGHRVWGIDASPRMLQQLQINSQGLPVTGHCGDISDFDLDQRFGLIMSLVSTLALLPALRQARALACAARHLQADGVLLVESTPAIAVEEHRTQVSIMTSAGPREYRAIVHSVPLAMHDEMAAAAGLRLQARWSDWRRSAWQPHAQQCISLYARQARPASLASPSWSGALR